MIKPRLNSYYNGIPPSNAIKSLFQFEIPIEEKVNSYYDGFKQTKINYGKSQLKYGAAANISSTSSLKSTNTLNLIKNP